MPDADKTWTIDSFTAQQNNSHAHSVYLQHHIHTSKSSQAQPTPLLASGKWNKIKQNCLNTPASAAQSESVHLDFCWIFQMVNSGMLEKVIFYLSFFLFFLYACINFNQLEREVTGALGTHSVSIIWPINVCYINSEVSQTIKNKHNPYV